MSTVFSSYDIRGHADTLTVEYAWTVGKAVAEWLPENGPVIVTEGAGANPALVNAVTEGVLLQGRDVHKTAPGDQQALIAAIGDRQATGGILVSHEDAQSVEIIAIFDAQGVAVTADNGLMAISELIDGGNFIPAAKKGELTAVA